MLMNKKQLKLKLSAITISVLLASCGGGGGYYGSNDNDSSGESGGGDTGGEVVTPTVTATGLKIELDKLAKDN